MPGNQNSPYPNSRGPYARQTDAGGNHFRADGTISPLPNGGNADPAAHIPIQQFQFRP